MIGDLARQVRYRCFDAPLIAAERAQAQQQVRAELDRLSPDPEARAAQIDAMVASGEPILGVFAERHHAVMLEVMTRRYYRIRPLQQRPGHRAERPPAADRRIRPRRARLPGHRDRGRRQRRTPPRPTCASSWTRSRPAAPCWSTSTSPPRRPRTKATATRTPAPDRIRDKLGTIPAAVGRVAVAVRQRRRRGAAAGRPGSPSAARRTGRRWRTGRSAACTRWSPSGWACGGCPDSS